MHPTIGRHHHSDLHCRTILASSVFLLALIFVSMFLLLTAQPASSQNPAPPTARQAMQIPQFAARLAPRTSRYPHAPVASGNYPGAARTREQRGWLPEDILYDNGPINGTTDACTRLTEVMVHNLAIHSPSLRTARCTARRPQEVRDTECCSVYLLSATSRPTLSAIGSNG